MRDEAHLDLVSNVKALACLYPSTYLVPKYSVGEVLRVRGNKMCLWRC